MSKRSLVLSRKSSVGPTDTGPELILKSDLWVPNLWMKLTHCTVIHFVSVNFIQDADRIVLLLMLTDELRPLSVSLRTIVSFTEMLLGMLLSRLVPLRRSEVQ